jgi:hypothetical protein
MEYDFEFPHRIYGYYSLYNFPFTFVISTLQWFSTGVNYTHPRGHLVVSGDTNFLAVLENKRRSLSTLDKCFTAELHSQPLRRHF